MCACVLEWNGSVSNITCRYKIGWRARDGEREREGFARRYNENSDKIKKERRIKKKNII